MNLIILHVVNPYFCIFQVCIVEFLANFLRVGKSTFIYDFLAGGSLLELIRY